MKIITDLDAFSSGRTCRGVVLTIGTYDGMHLGHQAMVRQLVARAHDQNWLSAILTFYPHPRAVLASETSPTCLSTPEERAAIAAELGLDLFVVHPFDRDVAATPAEAFLQRLRDLLDLRELWVGPDFALGQGRGGDVSTLGELAPEMGFSLRVLGAVRRGEGIISSTRVRVAIADGDMSLAASLLGRSYAVSGTVVHGAARGRNMGFPTANLRIPQERALPPHGVYAVRATVEGETWPGVANVGIRPSFDAGEVLVETYLLDFAGDLYGKELTVAFVERLRGEVRFEGMDALAAQIDRDVARAREVLGAKDCAG